MKTLLLILLAIAFMIPAQGAISYVGTCQGAWQNDGTGTWTYNCATTLTEGDYIVIIQVGYWSLSFGDCGCVGASCNVITLDTHSTSDIPVRISAIESLPGSVSKISCTLPSYAYMAMRVLEFSGLKSASAVNGVTHNSETSPYTSPATGNLTTTCDATALIAWFSTAGYGTIDSGPTNSFTGLTQIISTWYPGLGSAYRIVSAEGTYATDWTLVDAGAASVGLLALRASDATCSVVHGLRRIIE